MPDVFELVAAGDLKGLRSLLREHPEAASARDAEGISVLLRARYAGRVDLVYALLEAEPDLNGFDAAAVGDVDHLGDPGAWSPDGFTPLHLAAFFDQPAAVAALLERGADVAAVSRNPLGATPLHSAAGRSPRAVELLLLSGASLDAVEPGGYTPLHVAAANGDLGSVELLLDAGADARVTDDDGMDAAAHAERHDFHRVVERLRAASASDASR